MLGGKVCVLVALRVKVVGCAKNSSSSQARLPRLARRYQGMTHWQHDRELCCAALGASGCPGMGIASSPDTSLSFLVRQAVQGTAHWTSSQSEVTTNPARLGSKLA